MIANLITALASQGLAADLKFLKKSIASANPTGTKDASCQPEPLVSWIPENTGGYIPNPANNYIAISGLCFEPDRIVVVRGKGAVFPDTYHGDPLRELPEGQMRYWSMCNNDQRAAYPVVTCQADHSMKLDDDRYYTYACPDLNSRNPPPGCHPPQPGPLGVHEFLPNILMFCNMLSAASFQNSVEARYTGRMRG